MSNTVFWHYSVHFSVYYKSMIFEILCEVDPLKYNKNPWFSKLVSDLYIIVLNHRLPQYDRRMLLQQTSYRFELDIGN